MHTPGPWTVIDNIIVGPQHGKNIGPMYANHWLAVVEKEEAGAESNARLMAAAPVLLAACKAFVECCGNGLVSMTTEAHATLDKVRAAIAAAEKATP